MVILRIWPFIYKWLASQKGRQLDWADGKQGTIYELTMHDGFCDTISLLVVRKAVRTKRGLWITRDNSGYDKKNGAGPEDPSLFPFSSPRSSKII